jgi:hypothetical protein
MSATRPRLLTHDGVSPKPASRAVVRFTEQAEWSRPATSIPSPDPTFVTQLIASAELLAQGHHCSPEDTADALSAYRARQRRAFGTGRLTRQVI